MKFFKDIIKTIINSINPFYESNKQLEQINKLFKELKKNQFDVYRCEIDRLLNMTEDEKKNEHEKMLILEANQIINKLESNTELYKVFNNILRRNKLGKIEDNKNE